MDSRFNEVPKHTPGPWIWTGKYGRSNLFGADSELVLFEVGGLYCKGDALLIAAAPEMLQTLKLFYDWSKNVTKYPPYWVQTTFVDKCSEIIAKAEGTHV